MSIGTRLQVHAEYKQQLKIEKIASAIKKKNRHFQKCFTGHRVQGKNGINY